MTSTKKHNMMNEYTIQLSRNILIISTLALVLILLSSCGNPVSEETPSSMVEQDLIPGVTEETDKSKGDDPDQEALVNKDQLENDDAQSKTDDENVEEFPPVEKTYVMNQNYIIVPKDPETSPKKVVLLTFDDGPKEQEMVEELLDILDKHQAKAIFFVNGYRVKAKPELLQTIYDRGQVIGNHSWDHIDLKKEGLESIQEQIGRVQSQVEEITGDRPQFFRPPHGSSNEHVRNTAQAEGLLFMNWSNGSLDWDMGKVPMDERPAALIQNVFQQLHSGSNILMHELPWTVAALDELLTQLEDKGYSFVDPRAIDIELP